MERRLRYREHYSQSGTEFPHSRFGVRWIFIALVWAVVVVGMPFALSRALQPKRNRVSALQICSSESRRGPTPLKLFPRSSTGARERFRRWQRDCSSSESRRIGLNRLRARGGVHLRQWLKRIRGRDLRHRGVGRMILRTIILGTIVLRPRAILRRDVTWRIGRSRQVDHLHSTVAGIRRGDRRRVVDRSDATGVCGGGVRSTGSIFSDPTCLSNTRSGRLKSGTR